VVRNKLGLRVELAGGTAPSHHPQQAPAANQAHLVKNTYVRCADCGEAPPRRLLARSCCTAARTAAAAVTATAAASPAATLASRQPPRPSRLCAFMLLLLLPLLALGAGQPSCRQLPLFLLLPVRPLLLLLQLLLEQRRVVARQLRVRVEEHHPLAARGAPAHVQLLAAAARGSDHLRCCSDGLRSQLSL